MTPWGGFIMSEQNSNQGGLPVPSLAIIIALFTGYFFIDPPALDGFRPGYDAEQIMQVHGPEDVQARLWQDPFAAVQKHKHSPDHQNQLYSATAKIPASMTTEGGTVEVQLKPHASTVNDADMPHTLTALLKEITEEADESGNKQDEKKITILAAMVSAGPYPEQAEARLRKRYALVSGLGSSGFWPKDSEHIGYVQNLNEVTNNDKKLTGEDRLPTIMPYEWYENESNNNHVLLLWLDENAFKHQPLIKLNRLLGKLLDGKHDIAAFKLIGPAFSGTLKAMAGDILEVDKANKAKQALNTLDKLEMTSYGIFSIFRHDIFNIFKPNRLKINMEFVQHSLAFENLIASPLFQIYSATATAANEKITGSIDISIEKLFETAGISFQRTIATDDLLTDALVKELKLRIYDGEDEEKSNYQIAIVSEWDTLYGRSLPKAFIQSVCNNEEYRQIFNNCLDTVTKNHVHQFSYMRGIDGQIAEADKTKSRDAKNNKEERKKLSVERPEGRSQKDYLRRLAKYISDTDRYLKDKGTKGIRAIGVLGSDVYDKLLILRALRERFPKAIFFTTDLDASLLHPDNFPWTRNMIVASPFGLRLNDSSQESFPSFRDSYQTSVYRSTLMALDTYLSQKYFHEQKHSYAIYELGRNGPHYLTGSGENASSQEATTENIIILVRFTTIILLFLLLSICFWKEWIIKKNKKEENAEEQTWLRIGNPWAFAVKVYGGLSIFCLAAVATLPTPSDLKSWLIILSVAGIAMFYCYIVVLSWLHKQSHKRFRLLLKQYRKKCETKACKPRLTRTIKYIIYTSYRFVNGMSYQEFCLHLAAIPLLCLLFYIPAAVLFPTSSSGEPFSLTAGISMWPTEFLRAVAVWLSIFLLLRGWVNMKNNGRDIEDTLEIPVAQHMFDNLESNDIRKIWNDYCIHGRISKRICRSWLPAIIWMVICVLLLLVQSPNIPFRGQTAHTVDVVIYLLTLTSFIVLFMFVFDATLHCRYTIKQLIKYDTFWPSFMDNPLKPEKEINPIARIKRGWNEIRLIAMRTEDISATVYYPIIVALLLLIAQSNYFDNWDMPFSLMLIASVNIAITLGCAIALRRAAIEAKGKTLEKLRQIRCEALAISKSVERDITLEKLNFYEDQIRGESRGAFSPISQQPWLRAFTLFGGGGSGLLLIEYLARIN
jgi:hypothetical protein